MKRYIALLLALMVLCLAGCGNKAASVEMDVESVYEEMEDTLPGVESPDETAIQQAVSVLRAYGVNAKSGRE